MRMKRTGVTFNCGEIVIAPFRFTDIDLARARPCLIVSNERIYGPTDHIIALMITRAANSHWPLDLPIDDCRAAGLRLGSTIRFKVFSIHVASIGTRIGRIADPTLNRVSETLNAVLT